MKLRTSATTWPERLLRASNMVSTMPWMVRSGIERGAHLLDGLQQLRQTFEREELALQRHQDRSAAAAIALTVTQVERRRAVDQHIGVLRRSSAPLLSVVERIAQPERAVALMRDLELEAGEIHGRRHDVQARHRGLQDGVADARPRG